jgi:GAF domain-containing protein
LLRLLERKGDGFRASVLLLSDDGKRLLDAAAPSLPDAYRAAIHGLEIGPAVGSCGTAAFLNRRIVVSDIQTDKRWEPFRELAAQHDLAACWSEPVRAADGSVLGTLAMYYSIPRVPSEHELDVIEAAAGRAAILLDKARGGAGRAELVASLA